MNSDVYETATAAGHDWQFLLGDSCERMAELDAESASLSVHSPPFASLFTYSPSVRDLGNSVNRDEFFSHYDFVVQELHRVTKPGRLACVHVMDLPTTKATHGVIGLTDFSGQIVQAYQRAGWTYVARITIRKDPQYAAQRTKSQGLMFTTLRRDSSMTRPVHPDYLLVFRKPGKNEVPIKGDVDSDTWISWAEAIWDDIRESNTLNFKTARENADERHICPLQLDLIERCIRLWSNPGELVVSPFGGVGSEPYMARKLGRRGWACELKRSYWETAVANLRGLDAELSTPSMFDEEIA